MANTQTTAVVVILHQSLDAIWFQFDFFGENKLGAICHCRLQHLAVFCLSVFVETKQLKRLPLFLDKQRLFLAVPQFIEADAAFFQTIKEALACYLLPTVFVFNRKTDGQRFKMIAFPKAKSPDLSGTKILCRSFALRFEYERLAQRFITGFLDETLQGISIGLHDIAFFEMLGENIGTKEESKQCEERF